MAVPVRRACIIGYKGYVIGTDGSVYSEKTGRYLIPYKQPTGYLTTEFQTPCGRKRMSAHRLVALAFLPNPHDLPQVNHKNEVRHDNRVENLEWCTAAYNVNYGNCQKKIRANRHITHEQLKAFHEAGTQASRKHVINLDTGEAFVSVIDAARSCGSNHSGHISKVCKGKREKAFGYRWAYN